MKFEVVNYPREIENRGIRTASKEIDELKFIRVDFGPGESLAHSSDVAELINKVFELYSKIHPKKNAAI